MKTIIPMVAATLLALASWGIEEPWGGINRAVAQATDPPPDCTNGDCPPPPPDCTNGDCPPPPPDCTNGDCPPPPPDCTNGDCPPPPPDCTNGDCPTPTENCCCIGNNQPGDIRVCCCRSGTLETVSCRQSLVLETGYPDDWHQTLAQVTLNGRRPKNCDILLGKFCDPPIEEVCRQQKGKKVCTKLVEAVCKKLDTRCLYRFCGPDWFPYDEPAPDQASCAWWNQIYPCKFR